jgi:colanic acid biosynthesis glycosyl transferase WcaI
MKITFVCAVFPPEPEPAGVMARQLAERLSSDGHSVSMIVPVPNRPGGRIYEGYQGNSGRFETASCGYAITRCSHWLIGRERQVLSRVLENVTFGITSAWAALRRGRPDVLVIETWPLFAVQCCALLAQWWNVPFVYYIQDVYPEALEQSNYLRSRSLAARILRRWDARLCRQSAKIVVISPSMFNLVKESRNLAAEKLTVISNWQDATEFSAQSIGATWRAEQGISPSTFVAMFAGTLGHVSGAEVLVEVADLLRQHRSTLILCVGDGVRKQGMLEKARVLGLDNIRFLPFQPRERVVEVQQSADVMLLTMQVQSSDTSVPSKLVSYMAAGRPVICAANSTTTVARIVAESGAGVVLPPQDAYAIARAILDLTGRAADVEQMGRRARAYFEENMTFDRAHAHVSAMLREIAERKHKVVLRPASDREIIR